MALLASRPSTTCPSEDSENGGRSRVFEDGSTGQGRYDEQAGEGGNVQQPTMEWEGWIVIQGSDPHNTFFYTGHYAQTSRFRRASAQGPMGKGQFPLLVTSYVSFRKAQSGGSMIFRANLKTLAAAKNRSSALSGPRVFTGLSAHRRRRRRALLALWGSFAARFLC